MIERERSAAAGRSITSLARAKAPAHPAVQQALTLLASEQYGTFIMANLDWLSRSVVDFGYILRTAKKQGWSLIALDLGIDMTRVIG
ncbi:hypothetical protein BK819_01525 [Microbacterium sp. LCT-H2]|nr:hypothetical protein BK819_01525 [Microbacterium sp. LCT-H2]